MKQTKPEPKPILPEGVDRMTYTICGKCKGTGVRGWIMPGACATCRGTGWIVRYYVMSDEVRAVFNREAAT